MLLNTHLHSLQPLIRHHTSRSHISLTFRISDHSWRRPESSITAGSHCARTAEVVVALHDSPRHVDESSLGLDRAQDAARPSLLVSYHRTTIGMGETFRAQDSTRARARSDTMERVQVRRSIVLRSQRNQAVHLVTASRAQADSRSVSS